MQITTKREAAALYSQGAFFDAPALFFYSKFLLFFHISCLPDTETWRISLMTDRQPPPSGQEGQDLGGGTWGDAPQRASSSLRLLDSGKRTLVSTFIRKTILILLFYGAIALHRPGSRLLHPPSHSQSKSDVEVREITNTFETVIVSFLTKSIWPKKPGK